MRSRSLVLLCATLLCLLPACRKDPESAKRAYMESGQKYMQQGKYQQAEIQFRNALKIDPRFANAYVQLSKSAVATAKWQDAFSDLQRAVALDPSHIEARLTIGRLYLSSRQYDQAEEQALAVLQRDAKNVEALQLLGAAYLSSGREVQARDAFARVIQLAPSDASGYLDLGLMELSLRNFAAAEANLKKAVEVGPELPVAYADLANFYRLQQKPADAERVLRQGIARCAKAYPLNIILAEVLVASGRANDAAAELQRLLDASYAVPESAAAIGDFYVAINDNPLALQAYQRGFAASPKSVELANRISAVYVSAGRFNEAQALDDRILRENPGNPMAHVQHAQILLAQGRVDDALQVLQQQVADTPEFAYAYFVLGNTQWRRGAPEQSRDAFQNAVRLDPSLVMAWRQLTELALARNDVNSARAYAQKCTQLEPAASASHVLLGSAYLADKHYPQAREEFALAQRLAPRDAWPHARLAKAWAAEKHWTEAQREYQAAMSLAPDNTTLFAEYADYLLASPLPAQAVERARDFATAHPALAEAQRLLASVLAQRQQYAEAIEAGKRAVALDASQVNAYLTLGDAQQKAGRTDDALATYNKALSLQPRFAPLLTLVGNLYIEKNDLDSARAKFEAALVADPNFTIAESNLAWVFAQKGVDLDYALSLAQKAKQQMPQMDSLSDTLGWVHYKKGNYVTARTIFQDCVKNSPKVAVYHYHLGMVLAATGDQPHARAELETALRLKLTGVTAEEARNQLARLH